LIVLSFGLVIVALVALVVGLFQTTLTFIWVSIGGSVVAAVALLLGVLQRRPGVRAGAAAPTPAERPWAPVTPTVSAPAERTVTVPAEPVAKPVESSVLTALLSESAEAEAEPERPMRAKAAPARAISKGAPARAAAKAPAKAAPARAISKAAPARAAAKAPAKAAPARAISKAAPARAAAKAPAKAPAAAPEVIVIPDRDKYHTAECRFVKSAPVTESMTKQKARRRGLEPCGVCKP